jgi:hypothetical protein
MNKSYYIVALFLLGFFCFDKRVEAGALRMPITNSDSMKYTDSIIGAYKYQLLNNKKEAKGKFVDFHLADTYFKNKRYDTAIIYGKKYLRSFWLPPQTPVQVGRREMARYLCLDFYEMYKEKGDYKTALKYLKKIEKKYLYFFCGNSEPGCVHSLYLNIIDCCTKLGNQKQVEVYNKKLKDKFPNWN